MIYLWSVITFAGLTMVLAVWLMISERLLVSYGICKLDINAGEKPLEVQGGITVLSALYSNEIFIPSACGGRGSCGHCRITVTSGGGPVLPTETPYLTRNEIRSNIRLACQVKIRQDIYIRIPEEMLSVRLYAATVESTINLTHDIKEIRLRLDGPDEISHRPGQYVQIQAPAPDGYVFRAYSISSPAHKKNIVELIVRLVPGGIGSTYLHNLNVGDKVVFAGPYGEFVLNEDPSVEIICVGGGCGMAPMKNIIYTLYDRWPERSCRLFFGCRTTKDVLYLDEFRQLAKQHPNFHIVFALSDPLGPDEHWDGETGFIHLATDRMLEPAGARQAFLCGPPPMVEAVIRVLHDKGLAPEDIYYDEF